MGLNDQIKQGKFVICQQIKPTAQQYLRPQGGEANAADILDQFTPKSANNPEKVEIFSVTEPTVKTMI